MFNELENIKALVRKATQAVPSEDALKFSQAALNAANALMALSEIEYSLRHSNESSV